MILQNIVKKRVYIHYETTNKSFLDMHYFLKTKGIKQNTFFLGLLDPDLRAINPFEKNLNLNTQRKILKECNDNYYYFIREVVRIPVEGATGEGKKYQLHRGNLAMSYCVSMNISIFFELSRQLGKTLSVLIRLLWEFNFGTTHSTMLFLHKNKEGSKDNLNSLKIYRAALPSYLQMSSKFAEYGGKQLKAKDSVERLEHVFNGNRILTAASATSISRARSIGRGAHVPRIYFDEYGFAKFNEEIYLSMAPAYTTASQNARDNGGTYGIILTTTPGDLTTAEGKEAYERKESATNFDEDWYNWSEEKIKTLLSKNSNSIFVYIRFTFKQVGKGQDWLAKQIKIMGKKYDAIQRELLLVWSHANLNSPFDPQDLELVKSKLKDPIKSLTLRNYYKLQVYELMPKNVVPIIGVDPAGGGYKSDSSCITVINSKTTHVAMCFNCNFISIIELAAVIIDLVSIFLPNAVVNVERNGGFGMALLSKLKLSKIKKNLYYEIKEKVVEERFDGVRLSKNKKKVKVYGLDNTHKTRDLLIEILRERMMLHKDKFISPMLFKELETLEVNKRTGKVEAASGEHDDQVFSYLMAMYVWQEGVGLKERWNIDKISLRTDQNDLDDTEEELYESEEYVDLSKEIALVDNNDISEVSKQLDYLKTDKTMLSKEYEAKQIADEREALNQLLSSEIGRKAYAEKYHKNLDTLEPDNNVNIPDKVFLDFYKDEDNDKIKL